MKLFGLVTLAALLFLTACASSPCSVRKQMAYEKELHYADGGCPFKRVSKSDL